MTVSDLPSDVCFAAVKVPLAAVAGAELVAVGLVGAGVPAAGVPVVVPELHAARPPVKATARAVVNKEVRVRFMAAPEGAHRTTMVPCMEGWRLQWIL